MAIFLQICSEFVFEDYIIMITESLLEKKITQPKIKSSLSSDISPVARYNIVIDCYNLPCNILDGKNLDKIPESSIYEWIFGVLTKLRGKILFVFVCLLPGLDLLTLILSFYFALYYCRSLSTHTSNIQQVSDPFKKMTFDPQLCYTMNCDYYLFNIELKQLQGFSLNYQENVSDRLNLKRQRGKTSLMIYNAVFWASFHYFQKWQLTHYVPLIFSFLTMVIINTILIVLLVS